ncbi:MAG TPA: hypothetical protein PLQ97_14525 [Myxococcota bacterium]|nr:hypothetical protein [Myxococcota bacterium]HQK51946.1 hypothetical protein [Myxococcota bacterium]
MRPTPTLVRIHILQGYLARARSMMEALEQEGRLSQELRDLWDARARGVRCEARVRTLKRLLRRVRRRRMAREA